MTFVILQLVSAGVFLFVFSDYKARCTFFTFIWNKCPGRWVGADMCTWVVSLWVFAFPTDYNRSSNLAAEKGHLVCPVWEDACVSQCEPDSACTNNYRLRGSRPQCPVPGGRHARYTGRLQSNHSDLSQRNKTLVFAFLLQERLTLLQIVQLCCNCKVKVEAWIRITFRNSSQKAHSECVL